MIDQPVVSRAHNIVPSVPREQYESPAQRYVTSPEHRYNLHASPWKDGVQQALSLSLDIYE